MTKKIVTPEQKEQDYKKVAEAIAKVGDVGKALQESGLSRTAAIVLIKHGTGLSMHDIGLVLDQLRDLKSWCLKK